MYFPIGWPRTVNLSISSDSGCVNHICCDAVKILVGAITDEVLSVWYANPLIPITFHQRTEESIRTNGANSLIVWKPDSREIAVLTTKGNIILYKIDYIPNGNGILSQIDPPSENLKRESAELFIRENIPSLTLREICNFKLKAKITVICCISLTELLIGTNECELLRLLWMDLDTSNTIEKKTSESLTCKINLREIPFYINQNYHIKCLPPIGSDMYVSSLEYSPFIGGCATVFNNNRAAFLIANHLRFESLNMHGFWVPDVDDATVSSINHKFRLMAYGRQNSDIILFSIEDSTGGLELSHRLSLDSNVVPHNLGPVNELKWSPDGCVLAATWERGGISLWSTFGSLLMSTFNWDFGIHIDLLNKNPLPIRRIEWSTEGYQLFLTCTSDKIKAKTNVLQLNFVKSALTTNPCMASISHILLQGDDTLYYSQGDNLEQIYSGIKPLFPNDGSLSMYTSTSPEVFGMEIKKSVDTFNILSESKFWTDLQLPLTYAATNWPIRYSAVDEGGLHLAVAGRTGIAHYSMLTKKWKVFGNETQEKDFVVSGGLLYWNDYIIVGCYSLLDRTDEIRCYPEEKKLDNQFGNKIQVRAPIISLNMFQDQLIVLTADGIVSLFILKKFGANSMKMECAYEVDVKNICIHPACIVSLTVTNLRNDFATKTSTLEADCSSNNTESAAETIIVNVSGRILMIQRDPRNNVINSLMASCLASCVECFWTSKGTQGNPMHDSLWLYSGASGMRVWLPILPPKNSQTQNVTQHLHSFMSKRIMLSFPLKMYPLAILFDNVIALGVENESTLYSIESKSHFALPFCILEQKSQVYLHKILRQLIKRNLGYNAWEIAKSCRSLPYFSHSLELLLHEVLEEEATSKEPIPDALLPSVLNFIKEFPVYLETVVQCARKTEIALWPYLFSVAGKPKDLFQECLQAEELETAASFLVILQNLEPSLISKQYATLLLDIALKNNKWELAKDLIRFLKAIDPSEIDSPRSSMIVNIKIAPPVQAKTQVTQNVEAFNMILGPISRERSFSTVNISHLPKDRPSTVTSTTSTNITNANPNDLSLPVSKKTGISSIMRRKHERSDSVKDRKETFCIDTILQQHARTLLQSYKLIDLGYMSAFLDFHLVSWLSQEADRAAKLDDFVNALKCLHKELNFSAKTYAYKSRKYFELSENKNHHKREKQNKSDYHTKICQEDSLTSESGYFSLSNVQTNAGNNNISHIEENENIDQSLGKNKLSNVEKTQRKVRYSPTSSLITSLNITQLQTFPVVDKVFLFDLDNALTNEENTIRSLPEKMTIKIRYLLQLFIEANCIDYALVLSIILKDAASIGRIINGVIRSESLAVCCRIDKAFKRLIHWSLERNSLYCTFLISLRPHLCLLDQYILSAESFGENITSSRKLTFSDNGDDIDSNDVQMNVAMCNTDKKWSFEQLISESSDDLLQCGLGHGENSEQIKPRENVKQNSKQETGTCDIM